uniref:Uncharacterized protein n=1 Tax=viral metagenome TaxID=1070528 RepID=A0A6M3J2D6_9ZZZZ
MIIRRTNTTVVDFSAAGEAEIESNVMDALNAAIPASPTAISINALVKAKLVYIAPVTSSADTTHFVSSVMIGYGNDYFVGWTAHVLWDAGGASAAPQGGKVIVSDYVSTTGTFTIGATTQLAATDIVLLIHPSVASVGFIGDAAATGAVTTTDTVVSYIKQLVTNQLRVQNSMDFWSPSVEEVQITSAAATLAAMATVTVADLPAGAVVTRAIAMMKFRAMENIHATIANKLDGATVASTSQVIQVADDTPGTYYDAINFVDDQFGLAILGREGGDVIIGDTDISGAGKVDANDGYIFRWLLSKSDQNSINFNDCQFGLRVWYSLE